MWERSRFNRIIPAIFISMSLVFATPGINIYAQENNSELKEASEASKNQSAAAQEESTQEAENTEAAAQEQTNEKTAQSAEEQEAAAQAAQEAAAAKAEKVIQSTRSARNKTTSDIDEQKQDEDTDDTGEDTDSNGSYLLRFIKNANLRTEPLVTASSLLVVPYGISISSDSKVVNEESEVWYKVTYAGSSGYVREDMVEVSYSPDESDNEENTDENIQTEISEEAKGVTVDTSAGQNENSESFSTASAIVATNESTLAEQENNYETEDNATEVNHRKIDLISILFILASAFSFGMAVFTLGIIRFNYRKFRKTILKNRLR